MSEEIKTILVEDRELKVIGIKGYLFPDDIPTKLHAKLNNERISISAKLLEIHKVADPDSNATEEDLEEAFWYLDSKNILAAYDL